MAIVPVSLLGASLITTTTKFRESQKVTNPIAEERPSYVPENGTFRSYFIGGQAVSFGFSVNTSGFVTKEIDDVPCCCCGGRMILASELGDKAREFSGIRGEELADKIEEDKDFFRTPQRLIMMLAAEEARKHPGYDLTRAKNAAGNGLRAKTQAYCVKTLQEADAIAKAAYGEDNPVSKLIAEEIERIQAGKIERMHFTDKLEELEDEIDPITFHAILDHAMDIPKGYKEVAEAFSLAKGSAKDIAESLLKPSTQTIEHIHPKSHGGPNDTENFIAECKDCNNQRGNISYKEWLRVHPEYPSKAQKHIEWFQQQIIDGVIDSRYDSYGEDVKKTLSKESDGMIELKVLSAAKIKELREAKMAGKTVNVSEEIQKLYGEKEETEETAA